MSFPGHFSSEANAYDKQLNHLPELKEKKTTRQKTIARFP